jgi:cystathionine beta-lyase
MARRPPGRPETRLAHTGRTSQTSGRAVNPAVERGSTMLALQASELYSPSMQAYGRHGTSTHAALKEALAQLEGGASEIILVPSGLMACALPMLALAEPGAHFLVTDTAYGPTRRFCDRTLTRLGCTVDYFPPGIGAGIAAMLQPSTRAVFVESPGSLTFEVSDTPAIAAAAKASGALTIVDNTWSAGVVHHPLDLGADISVQATTKYVSGGSDALGGAIFTRDARLAQRMRETAMDLGVAVSPDDASVLLRGLRSLPVRMERHGASALQIASWLTSHPAVLRVIHPALETDPSHALWKRDFTGSSGLFGVVLKPAPTAAVHTALDSLELFGMGFSYGGFESLAIHCDPQLKRTAEKPDLGGPLLRLSIGLEAPEDLIADLDAALASYPAG